MMDDSELHLLQRLRALQSKLRESERARAQASASRPETGSDVLLAQLAQARGELDILRNSKAYLLGRRLADAVRRPSTLLEWPRVAWQLFRGSQHAGASPVEDGASETDGYDLPYRAPLSTGAHLAGRIVRLHSAPDLPASAAELRIAAICDEFTARGFSDECQMEHLLPDTWADQVRQFKPHIVFVESAWLGVEGRWRGKVSPPSPELCSLLLSCRHAGIETVFWNKEDPLHFDAFIEAASLCGSVLTTDASLVPRYRRMLGHRRVSTMPFAVQPRHHHPVAAPWERRQEASFFAGAWYPHLGERSRDFVELADALRLAGPLRIYDRHSSAGDALRQYPNEYRDLLRPAVDYELTPELYRGYRIGLTLNTIKQSPTMYARRALELMCTNTSVYGNFSLALAQMFGELVVATDDGRAMLDLAYDELRQPDALRYRHRRLKAMRKVLREHTWAPRVRELVEVSLKVRWQEPEPRMVVLSRVETREDALRLAAMAAEQQGGIPELWLDVPDGVSLPDGVFRLARGAMDKTPGELFGRALVAIWSSEDSYAPHYLEDLRLARAFDQGEVVGKASYPSAHAMDVFLNPEMEYRRVPRLAFRRSLAPAQRYAGSLSDLMSRIQDGAFEGDDLASMDALSYCEGRIDAGALRETSLNEGDKLSALLDFVDAAPDRGAGLVAAASSLPGAALAVAFQRGVVPAGTSVTPKGSGLELVSLLPPGREDALFSEPLPRSWLEPRLREGQVHLDADSSPAFDVYLDMLDAADGLVVRQRLVPGVGCGVDTPETVVGYRFSIALRGPYVGSIRSLSFAAPDPDPLVLPGHDRVLLVTAGYPSREALYRFAFVHSRVKEYQRRGVKVDVVCVTADARPHAYEFDGVTVRVCAASALRSTLRQSNHPVVAVHFLDEAIWQAIEASASQRRVRVWLHGAEIQHWSRRIDNVRSDHERSIEEALGRRRESFWRHLLADPPPGLELIFVSHAFARETQEDMQLVLAPALWRVIHNPIDTRRFAYRPKGSEQRFHILSIRPHASRIYANDMVAATIHALASSPEFGDLRFTLVGDGPLWEENFGSLAAYPNVKLIRQFLTQDEIAELHGSHGIFLVPTRGDTQGVSRDEAMASGLAPVTTSVGAVTEFVDEESGMVCGLDANELAQACLALVRDPALFSRLSAGAAKRVRMQSSAERITGQELDVLLWAGGNEVEESGIVCSTHEYETRSW